VKEFLSQEMNSTQSEGKLTCRAKKTISFSAEMPKLYSTVAY